jgi:hypothetical protein
MKIRELRILPPFAIGRLGSAKKPQDNYTIDDDPKQPLGYRKIVPAQTLKVNEKTGEIESSTIPETIVFKIDGKIRPVAPFLEVFAVLENSPKKKGAPEKLVKLDRAVLKKLGASRAKIEWRVSVANRKVMRRTENLDDMVAADTGWFSDHKKHVLKGTCKNFVPGGYIDFGHARFICPNDRFGEIRLRFTPAQGLIYGPHREIDPVTGKPDPVIPAERAIYDASDASKDWVGFGKDPEKVSNQTVPPSLFAIEPPAPSWLNNNVAVSRGYLDDACDGFVEVRLSLPGGELLTATARICSAPPAVVPDSLFIRSLADDLEQVIFGPEVPKESYEVTRNRALDIIRRAYETVRFMNVAVMNGNNINGRSSLSLDSMPEEEAADTERAIRPVMAPGSVDTIGIMTLHEQVFAALRGGAAPWFLKLLRRPHEVADFTDRGRRKMPALMCGADNNYLALTYRQIDTIRRVALEAPFHVGVKEAEPEPESLTALNLTAQLHYEAMGNPISSRPVTSVANCCPGLEVDFRAVWRRMFKGIVLREYDNLVMDVDPDVTDPAIRALVGQQLLRVRFSEKGLIPQFLMFTPIKGPASSDPEGEIRLTTKLNPQGIAAVEWSNALAAVVLRGRKGKHVYCDFTKDLPPEKREMMQEIDDDQKNYITLEFEVRKFFDEGTAVISKVLASAGELTQGLCSPWQNDYRECSCYYWASARPDFINVEPAGNGLSKGDNWFQIERTGTYVPDDYVDSRLVLYDELFLDWEHWLRFQVGGRDYMEEPTTEANARPVPRVTRG